MNNEHRLMEDLDLKTTSVILQTLCVPCECRCRYCLLSWDGHPVGAAYERSQEYARKFYLYMKENMPETDFHFTFGYSMEHPRLFDALDFLNEVGSVQGQFLQMDGMRFRSEIEADELMQNLMLHGVKSVNYTFYGQEIYHDRFAKRQGDFRNLLTLAKSSLSCGMDVSAGIPLTSENTGQTEELIRILEDCGIQKVSVFVPHEEGRGVSLAPIRFSESDFCRLGAKGQSRLNCMVFRPEKEWISGIWPEEQNRSLIISLTPDNLEKFERMGFAQVIRHVEKLDENYYASLPSFADLCRQYGNPDGTQFYSKRDLFRHYQKRYIKERGLVLYDVTDERYCGSRRY